MFKKRSKISKVKFYIGRVELFVDVCVALEGRRGEGVLVLCIAGLSLTLRVYSGLIFLLLGGIFICIAG